MKTLALVFAGLLTAAVALGQAERASPPWQVTVVDEGGQPIAGCAVNQTWGRDFGGSAVVHGTNAVTDAQGRVALPPRFLTPPADRGSFKSVVKRLNAPAASKPWTAIAVYKPGYEIQRVQVPGDASVVWTAEGLRCTVVLRRPKVVR